MVVCLCTGYPSVYGAALVCTLPSPVKERSRFIFYISELWIGLFQVHSFLMCFVSPKSTEEFPSLSSATVT
jgi:hypothetical protein